MADIDKEDLKDILKLILEELKKIKKELEPRPLPRPSCDVTMRYGINEQ